MKQFNIFIALLIYAALFTSFSEAYSLFYGKYEGLSVIEGFNVRPLREIILGIIIFLNLQYLKKNFVLHTKTLLIILFSLFYMSFEFLLFIFNNDSIIVPLLGLRIFEYIPVAYLAYLYYIKLESVDVSIIKYIKIFIYLEIVLGIFEIMYALPSVGVTAIGVRPFGTFSSPNVYGLNMAALALLIYIMDFKNNKLLFYLTIVMALLSGSRLAIILALWLVFADGFLRIKSNYLKFASLVGLPFLAVFMYIVSKSESISGRAIGSEERLGVWSSILLKMDDIDKLLFGWGLGLGSNSVTAIYGPNFFNGQFISDSTYIYILSSFGLIGLFIYFFVLLNSFITIVKPYNYVFIVFIFLAGIPFIFFEIFPANLILMYLWGYLFAVSAQRKIT